MEENKVQDNPEVTVQDTEPAEETRGKKKGLFGGMKDAGKYQGQATAAFLVLAGALIFYYLLHGLPTMAHALRSVTKALAPAIWGFCIAFLMNPLVRLIERVFIRWGLSRKGRKGETPEQKESRVRSHSRGFAILITVVLVLAMITLLLVAIIPEFTASIETLLNNVPSYAETTRDSLEKLISKNETIKETFQPIIESSTESLKNFLQDRLTSIISTSAKLVTDSLKAILRVLFNLLIGLIFAIYMMKDKEYLIGLVKKIIFAVFPKKTAKVTVQTLHKANGIFSTAILGKILDSAVIGMLCFIGTNILGLFFDGIAQYKGLVSIIIGVTNVIPFFGPFIGGIPCAFLIFCANPVHGLVFAGFILVLQQFDGNYLDPHIVGKKVGMKPIYVLLACTLFSNLWGILGMLIAVPTFALVYSIMKSFLEVRLEEKHLPKETESYISTPGAVLVQNSIEAARLKAEAVPVKDDRTGSDIKNC